MTGCIKSVQEPLNPCNFMLFQVQRDSRDVQTSIWCERLSEAVYGGHRRTEPKFMRTVC